MTSESNWELIVREPGRPHRKIQIAAGVSLGRHPRCNCVLSDPSVSSTHAKIVELGAGRLALEAFKTSNGTRVVGAGTIQPGQRHELTGGAVLLLGASEIEVVAPPSSKPAQSPIPAPDSQATMPQLAGNESTMASPGRRWRRDRKCRPRDLRSRRLVRHQPRSRARFRFPPGLERTHPSAPMRRRSTSKRISPKELRGRPWSPGRDRA